MAAGSFGVKHVTEDGQRFLHDGRKVHDGGHGGSLLTALTSLGRQRGVLHYTPSSLLCKTSVHKSHRADPQRLARLFIAACLADIWVVYLGALCEKEGWREMIHRRKRCD